MLFFRRAKKDDRVAGEELFAKGQWAPALEAYERVLERDEDKDNVKILRRVADLRARLGRRADAAQAYRRVAELYAGTGFLVQAIAIEKILLRLDPAATDVGGRLAELYAKRGIRAPAGDAKRELPAIPLFSDLDPDSFRQLVARLVPRTLELGQPLFRQGDPGDSLFVVACGAVKVVRGGLALAELGEGEFFGEAAFFSREPRNADVVAVAPTEVLELRREDLEPLMASHERVSEALWTFYRRRVLDGILATCSPFDRLPDAARRQLADLFRAVSVRAGEVVVREGSPERSLYLIRRGRFSVAMLPPGGGASVHLAELGPGEFFGEVALVSGIPRTATVAAVEEGEVLTIEPDALAPFLEAHPALRSALERSRDERARDAVAKVLGRQV